MIDDDIKNLSYRLFDKMKLPYLSIVDPDERIILYITDKDDKNAPIVKAIDERLRKCDKWEN